MKVLVDVNVVLDVLQARQPHLVDSAKVMRLIEESRVDGLLCATGVTTIAYLARKAATPAQTRRAIDRLLAVFEIAMVNRGVLQQAVTSKIGGFEDAVVHASAVLAGADAIVTRNVRDFRHPSLPVHDPAEFLAMQA